MTSSVRARGVRAAAALKAVPPLSGPSAPAAARGAALLLAAVCTLLLLVAGCGGTSTADWSRAETNIVQVQQLLQQGKYARAKATWTPVDNVIHAVYPRLHGIDPQLAGSMWHAMGQVELGFLSGDWDEAQTGARALPKLLKQAQEALR